MIFQNYTIFDLHCKRSKKTFSDFNYQVVQGKVTRTYVAYVENPIFSIKDI